ncbi:iron-containing alcohol dehydrogenase [Chitinophaga sp. 22536]|uniref:iron-containing alcohol dehydrogenase n=1 Tax=unclassified Chitinophaga TaxID=2619133 RepID=UPI003F86D965
MYDPCSLSSLGASIKRILHTFNTKKVLLIHGYQSFKDYESVVTDAIAPDILLFRASGFSLYPELEDILNVANTARLEGIDTVIAIGGGTIIDIAKSVSVLWQQEAATMLSLLDTDIDFLEPQRLKLLTIPTTCGTGAEVTPFAVIYNGAAKHSFYGNSLIPQQFIHCPPLAVSLSNEQIAVGAFDTLSQAIESIWSKGSVTASREYAGEAVRLVMDNIDEAVRTRSPKAMTCLMKASFLSGRAIAITKTTGPHALSYPLTRKFSIPHGLAVMITLPYFFLFHDKILSLEDESYPVLRQHLEYILGLLNVKSGRHAFEVLCGLAARINVDISLSAYISAGDLAVLQQCNFNEDRLRNHPVTINRSDIQQIFTSSFDRLSAIA